MGLTQVGAWIAMGGAMAAYSGGAAMVAGVNVFQYVDLRVIPWFFVFFLLGYLTYVCIYAVGGAISNSDKEAQQFMGPIMMVVMVPWMLAFPILQNPDSTLATVLSLIPVFTPITMFMRMLVSGAADLAGGALDRAVGRDDLRVLLDDRQDLPGRDPVLRQAPEPGRAVALAQGGVT